ncbi:hypothetical protein P3T22_003672 [Paraburkholderia sp. GAS348]
MPFAVIPTGADRYVVTQPLSYSVPTIRRKRGESLTTLAIVQVDHDYDHDNRDRPLRAADVAI